jgi:hypothetical protein
MTDVTERAAPEAWDEGPQQASGSSHRLAGAGCLW